MIESVNFAKKLAETTKLQRQEMVQLAERADKAENDGFHLENENRELRDRIEILESVIAQSSNTGTDDIDKMDWREILEEDTQPPSLKTQNETVNEIISQLFNLKREKAKRDEANSALMSENNQLKQQIDQIKMA